jgi:protein-tyrosine phosphatase
MEKKDRTLPAMTKRPGQKTDGRNSGSPDDSIEFHHSPLDRQEPGKDGSVLGRFGKRVRVLFLCTGNYYRSRLAEELLRDNAKKADLKIECDSAGLGNIPNPSNPGPIGIAALHCLQRLGISSPSLVRYPKKCTLSDLQAADIIVCLSESEHREMFEKQAGPFLDHKRVIYWHVPDVEEDPDLIGPGLIHGEVRGLLARLTDKHSIQNGLS